MGRRVKRTARRIHLLLGVFFAPTLLFFTVTGAMQVAGLQQRKEGREPPKWVAHVVEVHKHQKWQPRKRPAPPPGQSAAPPPAPAPPPSLGTTLLKGFSLALSLALVLATLLGVYIAWLVPKDRRLTLALFVLGTIVPASFLMF
jgi:hypothetical protein